MEPIKSSTFENAIIYIKIIKDNFLVVVDSKTVIRYLDLETQELKSQLKANVAHERFVNSVVAFCSDAQHFALIGPAAKESKLYSTTTKKLIGVVNRHQGEVSCVAIDPKDRYMFSGGDDGITFGIDIKSGQLAFTLPRHIDTINDIAFSKNGDWVATGSYDKNIAIFNLASMTPKDRLKYHSAPIIKLRFLDGNRLLSIDKSSNAVIWNMNKLEVIAKLQGIHDDVIRVTTAEDDKFLFIGTKLGYILVYDLKTYEKISTRYIKLSSSISALTFDEDNKHLLVGTSDGKILFYNIYENENSMHQAVAYKKYSQLQPYIDANPILVYTKIYASYEELWEQTLQKAKELLENGNKQGALKLFESFIDIPSKKQLIQKLFVKYDNYENFLTLVKQKKLALAYGMANSNPVFKDTKAYEFMEAQWKKSVAMAQKYLQNPNTQDKVKELFAPYRGIPEKTIIIQDLLTNSMILNRFKSALSEKNFKIALEYTKRHQFLKDSKEYDALIKYSDTLYIKAQSLRKAGDSHAAIRMYRMLLDFDDFKDEAAQSIKDVENEFKFFSAVNEKNLVLAYGFLDTSDFLCFTHQGVELQKLWEDDYDKASEFAAKADVEGIKKSLDKYLNIKSKYMAIATLVSWCYITELNRALKAKLEQKIIEDGIKNYILYFGLSDQIVTYFNAFLKEYPQTKLSLESQVEGSFESWRPSMIIKSIIEAPLTCSIA